MNDLAHVADRSSRTKESEAVQSRAGPPSGCLGAAFYIFRRTSTGEGAVAESVPASPHEQPSSSQAANQLAVGGLLSCIDRRFDPLSWPPFTCNGAAIRALLCRPATLPAPHAIAHRRQQRSFIRHWRMTSYQLIVWVWKARPGFGSDNSANCFLW